jgi:hypothetical protein
MFLIGDICVWMMCAIYIAALLGDIILWMSELKWDSGWISDGDGSKYLI